VHPRRSQPRSSRPGSRRTTSFVGKPVARVAELLGHHGPTLAVRPLDSLCRRRELFPSCVARTGVTGMSRQIVFRSFLVLVLASTLAVAQNGAPLRFCLHSDPKTFNPLVAEEDSSETVRYLTGGVLMRLNRMTQELE